MKTLAPLFSKWIRRLVLFVSLLSGLVLLGFAWVLSRPTLEIPEHFVRSAVDRFAPESLDLKWAHLQLRIRSHGWLDKQIELALEKPCLTMSEPILHVCTQNLWVSLRTSVAFPRSLSYHFDDIRITDAQVRADFSQVPASTSQESTWSPSSLGPWLRWLWDHLGEVEANLAKGEVNLSSLYRGSAEIRKKDGVVTISADVADVAEASPLLQLRLELEQSARTLSTLEANLKAIYHARPKQPLILTASVQSEDWQTFRFNAQARSPQFRYPFSIDTTGTFHDSRVQALLSGTIQKLAQKNDRLQLKQCTADVDLNPRAIQLICPDSKMIYEMANTKLLSDQSHSLRLFQTLHLKLKQKRINDQTWLDANLNWRGHDQTHLIKGSLEAQGQYNLSAQTHSLENLKQEGLAVSLQLPSFEGLVKCLKTTPYAIPAPLNVLKGPVELSAKSEREKDQLKFPFLVRTRLRSSQQILQTTGRGSWSVRFDNPSFASALDLDLLIEDLLFTLPPLAVQAPPQLFPDSRFAKKPFDKSAREPASESPRHTYRVRLHTSRPDSIRIASNLTGRPLPVTLDMVLSTREGLGGTIQVGTTPLNVLKRDADLQYFRLSADPVTKRRRIDGKIVVSYTDYRISILLSGTVDEPKVQFESQPPLEQQQIIAVLVFGRPLEQLADDQRSSVASMNSAVTEAALSLGSMYVLASTPIEQMAYNPDTRKVSAKVRLRENWALNLSARDAELNTVGLRRRVGANWAVNTYMEDLEQTTSHTVKVFLEWFKRY